jgi:hypothetical protein
VNIQALWVSGSIDSWASTVNSSKNGEKGGIAFSHETLQLNDIRRSGIILSRWYYDFPHQEEQAFTTRDEEDAPFKVIVRPEEVADLLMLTVDGKVVLERVMADENGDPKLSEEGVLCNMLLPNMDAVEGDILEPTAESAGSSELVGEQDATADASDVTDSTAAEESEEDEESPKSETEDVDQATGTTDGRDVGGAVPPASDDSSADVSDFVDLGDVDEDESEQDDTDVSDDFAPDDSDMDAQADEFTPEADADDDSVGGGKDEDDGFNLDW